jgi:hypothetical protein
MKIRFAYMTNVRGQNVIGWPTDKPLLCRGISRFCQKKERLEASLFTP